MYKCTPWTWCITSEFQGFTSHDDKIRILSLSIRSLPPLLLVFGRLVCTFLAAVAGSVFMCTTHFSSCASVYKASRPGEGVILQMFNVLYGARHTGFNIFKAASHHDNAPSEHHLHFNCLKDPLISVHLMPISLIFKIHTVCFASPLLTFHWSRCPFPHMMDISLGNKFGFLPMALWTTILSIVSFSCTSDRRGWCSWRL